MPVGTFVIYSYNFLSDGFCDDAGYKKQKTLCNTFVGFGYDIISFLSPLPLPLPLPSPPSCQMSDSVVWIGTQDRTRGFPVKIR